MTELTSIVGRARELARPGVARDASEVDTQARWPEAGLRALQREGLGGLVVPAASGGLGLGLLALARVCEELGRSCASTGISFGMHCVASAVIAAKATPYQRGRYLEAISAGRHFTTLALSEPGSGAHFYYPQTRLVADSPDMYRVTGDKVFVTNGGHADSYVVSTVAAEAEAPPGHFSCVLVAAGADGLAWGAPWQGLGMRGNSSRALGLRGVPVPRRTSSWRWPAPTWAWRPARSTRRPRTWASACTRTAGRGSATSRCCSTASARCGPTCSARDS